MRKAFLTLAFGLITYTLLLAQPPGKGPPGKGGRKDSSSQNDAALEKPGTPTIQWYTSWDDAAAEAKASGKPILMVSAAPHCAGVPGIW